MCIYIRQIGNKLQFFFLHAMMKKKERKKEGNERKTEKKEKKRKTFLILLCHSHELLIFNFSHSTLNERFFILFQFYFLQIYIGCMCIDLLRPVEH